MRASKASKENKPGDLAGPFGIAGAALKDIWENLLVAASCSLAWLVCVGLVLPGPPATLALFYVSHRLSQGEVVDLRDFWEGLRRYWKLSWRWALPNAALIAILLGDYSLTGRLSKSPTAHFVQGFYLALLVAWVFLQIYALPFLFEQEEPSVRLALRNASVFLGKNLGFSLLLAVLLGAILFVGVLLFLVSVAAGGIFVALCGNRAVHSRLEGEHQLNSARS